MPPGPAYNWLCVLYSTAEILSHAARHRATQIVPRSTSIPLNSPKRRRTEELEIDELTKGVQPAGQDTDIPPLVAKASEDVISTVQVQSQDVPGAQAVYASSIIRNVDTQTVYFNPTFNRVFRLIVAFNVSRALR